MSQDVKGTLRDSFIYTGFFVLLLVSALTPFNIITIWFLPLPLMILTVRQQASTTLISSTIVAIVLILLLRSAALVLVYPVFVGLVMGLVYKDQKQRSTDVVLSGIVTAFVSLWIIVGIGEWLFSFLTRFQQYWAQVTALQKEMFGQMGIKTPTTTMEDLLPYLLFMIVVPVPLITFKIARRWLAKGEFARPPLKPLRQWQLPRIFVFVFIVTVFLFIFGLFEKYPYLEIVYISLRLLFFIQGIAFCAFLLSVWGKSKLWLIPIILVSLFPIFIIIFEILGLMDASSSWRERMKNKKEE